MRWFPYPQLKAIWKETAPTVKEVRAGKPWYNFKRPKKPEELRYIKSEVDPDGLTLITRVADDKTVDALVINAEREVLHRWPLDIFRDWPEPENAPRDTWPKQLPGALIHGAVVLENGDLIFNYEGFGVMRVDACANPVWKLPKYVTHHSVEEPERGDFWVSARLDHDKPVDWMPKFKPRSREPFAVRFSAEGEVLEAISIPRILQENNYHYLLYLDSVDQVFPVISGDPLHYNDVEEFPESMQPGVFGPGDILVSLRNIFTVFVFNKDSRKIKFISTGQLFRQHDPDFLDGDHISVFNNNILGIKTKVETSEIVILSARDGSRTVAYPRNGEKFRSAAQGKHQWLDNGHLLITEAQRGRAFEVDTQGNVVWEYVNYLNNGYVGLLLEATRLDKRFTAEKFIEISEKCSDNQSVN